VILIPVKNLDSAKERLSPMLTPRERCELARVMLDDVLAVLAACAYRDVVTLVTGDPLAKEMAARYAFEVLEDPINPGETGAIANATMMCIRRGAEFTLVMPSDIPVITAAEVDRIFAAAPVEGAVLVPSGAGRGTNAAFRRPANLFPLQFGNDSFLPHLAAARATGRPVEVLRLSGIGLDVDEPEDLARLLSAPGDTRSQQLLRQWGVVARFAADAASRRV